MQTLGNTKNELSSQLDFFESLLAKLKEQIPNIIIAFFIIFIGYIIAKESKNLFKKVMNKRNADITVTGFFSQVLYINIILVFLIIALTVVGVPSSSFVTTIGALGLAIGLALQSNLSNFVSGIIILIFKPFKVGDFIETKDGVSGTVYSITIMNTALDTADNKKIYIPNSNLTTNHLINFSQNSLRVLIINTRISYESDHNKAINIIKNILLSHEYILDKDNILCVVSDLEIQYVNILSKVMVLNNDYFTIKYDILKNIKDEFDKENIKFAFLNSNIKI